MDLLQLPAESLRPLTAVPQEDCGCKFWTRCAGGLQPRNLILMDFFLGSYPKRMKKSGFRISVILPTWHFFVPFLGWLSDPFQRLSDLQQWYQKVTDWITWQIMSSLGLSRPKRTVERLNNFPGSSFETWITSPDLGSHRKKKLVFQAVVDQGAMLVVSV